jgi:D-alanine-D-alanine ligase
MSTKLTVAILYGGKSAEYEVSIQTAYSVINAIDKDTYRVLPIHITNSGRWLEGPEVTEKLSYKEQLLLDESPLSKQGNEWLTPLAIQSQKRKPDIIFPLLHGPNGEDGTVQGLFELLDIAYVGSGVAGSAVGMDKILMKDLFKAHGIEQAAYFGFDRDDWDAHSSTILDQIEQTCGFPCFVKPANLGSSIGITKAQDREELHASIKQALQYDEKVVVEERINGREIEMGVIGNGELRVSVPGEITFESDFYDYQSKYQDGASTLVIPADLGESQDKQMEDLAKKAFKLLNCKGLARADFFIEEDTGRLLLNELNTMPGFTPYSMFPLLWKHTGVSYQELITTLINLGLERHQKRRTIKHRIEE